MMANFIQNMMKIKGSVYNNAIESDYNRLLKSQFQSREDKEEKIFVTLKKLLKHAYDTTHFYHERCLKEGIHPEDIKSYKDFSKLPTVTREDLNDHLDEMISGAFPACEIHRDATGGSTGCRTIFARDNSCLNIKKAAEYRFNSFTGWVPGEKILYYWPAIVDFTKKKNTLGARIKDNLNRNIFARRISVYAGELNEAALEAHVDVFNKFKPDLIRAFPNSLQLLAEYAKQRNISWRVKRGIISVGEPLNQSQRDLFRSVFNCDVYNCYVSRETGNIACECEYHKGLHVSDELVYLEIDSKERTDFGEIIITDLTNFGMPLIRYRIQDASRCIVEKCPCGRTLSLIDISAARLNDYLVSPCDGSYISGSSLVHYLLAEGPKVGRFQLIQKSPDNITLKITEKVANDEKSLTEIKEKIEKILRSKINFQIEVTEQISFLKSGKYQFVLRDFTKDQ